MKARTLKDIQNHPLVESVHSEDDGYREDGRPSWWVYLKPGYISESMECGTIHEGTIAECCELLNNDVRRVTGEEIIAGFSTSVSFEEAQRSWAEAEGHVVLVAENIGGFRYAVRPEGQLGTCGFHPEPWTVQYITATNKSSALTKALRGEQS